MALTGVVRAIRDMLSFQALVYSKLEALGTHRKIALDVRCFSVGMFCSGICDNTAKVAAVQRNFFLRASAHIHVFVCSREASHSDSLIIPSDPFDQPPFNLCCSLRRIPSNCILVLHLCYVLVYRLSHIFQLVCYVNDSTLHWDTFLKER